MRLRFGKLSSIGIVGVTAGIFVLVAAPGARAQGCMPLHFTTPSLGGEAIAFLHAGQWQAGFAVRRVATNKFFVGDAENEAAAPNGQPLDLRLNTVDVNVAYALSDRTTISFAAPIFYGTAENTNGDLLRHQQSNSGIGDVSLIASTWLLSPLQHPTGNISIGLGVKAPTGSYSDSAPQYRPHGITVQMPVSPTLQLGDGGWAILAQGQAFQQLAGRLSAYASGVYSASLREHTNEVWMGQFVSVPDVYSARAGLAMAIAPDQGVSISLGGRIDGTTVRDIVGGRDDFLRDAGNYMYVEPGLAWATGPNQFTLSVPVRVHANYYSTVRSNGQIHIGTGGVNDYIIYAGYSRRF